MIFVVVLWLATAVGHCNFYRVPSYYGYWSRNFFLYTNLTQGRLRMLQMNANVENNPDEIVYVADAASHVIRKANLTDDTIQVLAGNLNRGTPYSKTAGNRIGSTANVLFNGPGGIVYHCENSPQGSLEEQLRVVVARNSTCSLAQQGCILTETDVEGLDLSYDNVRFVGPNGTDMTQSYKQIEQGNCPSSSKQFLYVADTNNHCIKRIDLKLRQVKVIAGKCGTAGFMDGPPSFNRLNLPRNIGVTQLGEVVFFDSGNEYLRLLYLNGTVATLRNGACTAYPNSHLIRQYELRSVLCYLDWIEEVAPPTSNHIFQQAQIVNTCTQQYSQC